jgi:hypothetical protein
MNNNLLFVITNEKNTLDLSLKFCNNMKFIISSNNIKEAKEFYIQNNIDITSNLITTFQTNSYIHHLQSNSYDHVFNTIIFLSKIINKLYSTNNIKYNILFCVSKKHIQRTVILASYIIKNISSVKFIYDNNEIISKDDIVNEKHQLNLFYQTPYYKN